MKLSIHFSNKTFHLDNILLLYEESENFLFNIFPLQSRKYSTIICQLSPLQFYDYLIH